LFVQGLSAVCTSRFFFFAGRCLSLVFVECKEEGGLSFFPLVCFLLIPNFFPFF
jgi:hypothetical protein